MAIRFLDDSQDQPITPPAQPARRVRFLDEAPAPDAAISIPETQVPKPSKIRFLDEPPAPAPAAPSGDFSFSNIVKDGLESFIRGRNINAPPEPEETGYDPIAATGEKVRNTALQKLSEFGTKPVKSDIERNLRAGAGAAGTAVVEQLPFTPGEGAAFALGGEALKVLGAGGAKLFPKVADLLSKPIGELSEYAIKNLKYKLGIPQELGLEKVDLAKAVREGRISEAQAARMDDDIYREAVAKRSVTESQNPFDPAQAPAQNVPPVVPSINEVDLPSPTLMKAVAVRAGENAPFYVPNVGLSAGNTILAQTSTSLSNAFNLTPNSITESLLNSAQTYQTHVSQGTPPEMAQIEANKVFWSGIPVMRSLGLAFPNMPPEAVSQLADLLKGGDVQASADILNAIAQKHPNLQAIFKPLQEALKPPAETGAQPAATLATPARPPQELAAGVKEQPVNVESFDKYYEPGEYAEEPAESKFVRSNLETFKKSYQDAAMKELGTDTPNYVSADLAKTIDVPGRNPFELEHSVTRHQGSSAFSKAYYDELLSNPETQDLPVIVSAGVSGSGKTSSMKNMGFDLNDYAAVYDTNLSKVSSAERIVDKALESNPSREVDIFFVERDPIVAFKEGVFKRFMEHPEHRVIPIEGHISNMKARDAIEDIYALYKDNPRVKFHFLDNTQEQGKIKEVTLDKLPKSNYTESEVRRILHEYITEKSMAGVLTERQALGFRGNDGRGAPQVRGQEPGRGIKEGNRGGREEVSQVVNPPQKPPLPPKAAGGLSPELPEEGMTGPYGPATPANRNLISKINKATGITPAKKMVEMSEDYALRKEIRDEVRGSKEGFKAGRQFSKEQIMRKFKEGEETIDAVIDFIKEQLPLSERGRFLNAIAKARTPARQYSIFRRINDQVTRIESQAIENDIKELIDPVGSVDLEYQKMISDKIKNIDLKQMNEASERDVKSLANFIRTKGAPLGIPKERLDAIERLSKTPLSKMTLKQKFELRDNLEMLTKLGKLKRELKYKYNQRELAVARGKLVNSTHNIDPASKGDEEKDKRALKWKQYYMDVMHTPRVADMIDGYKGYAGENAKHVKQLGALETRARMRQITRMNEILEKVAAIQPDLTESDMQSIVFHLHKEQGAFSQAQALITNFGWKAEPKLTENQRKIIDVIRPLIDKYDEIAPIFEETTNEMMGKVYNYFPLKYVEKEPSIKDIADLIKERFRKTQPFKGFTFGRQEGVKQVPRTDLLNILHEAIGEQEWYIHFQPAMENLKYLFKSQEYLDAGGKLATNFWINLMDIVTRRGFSAGYSSNPILKQARINLQKAVLGFKLTSAVVQPMAIFDAIAFAQAQYGSRVAAEILKESTKNWINPVYAKAVINNSPTLLLREGAGEMAIAETLEQAERKESFYGKIVKAALYPLRKLDVMTAAGVEKGFENILAASGVQNAKEEAGFLMNLVSGSNDVTYRPQILSHGEGARTWFTFQNFALNQWGILWHDLINSGIYHGEGIAKKLNSFVGLMMAIAGIIATNEARKQVYQVSSGNEIKNNSPAFQAMTAVPFAVPFFGNIADAAISSYGGGQRSFMPPTLKTLDDIFKGATGTLLAKKSETKKRNALKFARGTAALTLGIPGTYQLSELMQRMIAKQKTKHSKESKKEFPGISRNEFKRESFK